MSEREARELNARLYIEGRSVPFQGINATFKLGQPGIATIKVPPLPEIKRIKPRTMVHVFVKDFSSPAGTKPWVLLFEGEAYGYSFGKSTSGRSFNIYAMDYSNYWDNAKQFYMNLRNQFGDINTTLAATNLEEEVNQQGARSKLIQSSIKAYLTKIITQKLNDGGDFLEAITDILKKIEEVNPFFRYNQARYRINDRILFNSSQKLDEIFDFLDKDNMWEQITGGGNGGMRTVRQVVNQLMSMIFHDFVSVPCPSKVTKRGIERGIGAKNQQTIGSFIFKPESFMLPPPKCNVLFPDMYTRLSFNRNFFHEVTRVKMNPVPTIGERLTSFLEPSNKGYFSPRGFNEFRTGRGDLSVTPGEQYGSEVEQGQINEEADDLANTTTTQEFNFLSREEILKGIFPDFGNVIPASQVLMAVTAEKEQDKFFGRAIDYLFFKKRLASRAANVSGPLNLAPVPGFTMLLVDDSVAEQNIIGVLDTITHDINSMGGASTSYSVTFARDVDEEDLWSNDVAEPPIPNWYDENVFGKLRPLQEKDYVNLPKSQQGKVKRFETVTGFEGTSIDEYYTSLLGNTDAQNAQGAQPIVNDRFPNMYAATLAIIESYRTAKNKKEEKDFVRVQTRRDYVLLTENFRFLGAEIREDQTRVNFLNKQDIIFTGEIFDGGYVNLAENENSRDVAQ